MQEFISNLASRFTAPQPVVSAIRLSGVISAGGSFGRSGLCIGTQAAAIKAAFAPKRLAAVALLINSPGGSPVQSSLIAQRIRQHALERKVPVVAFVEDVAASGGYWLACAADEIYVNEASILGSIGVVSAGFGLQGAIRKLGIERRLYTQGENKSMLDPFLPEKEEDVERLLRIQADMHQVFKDWVTERRGAKLKSDQDLFNGDIWTGKPAVELGLVDGIDEVRAHMRRRFGDKVNLRLIGGKKPLLRRLIAPRSGFGGDLAADTAAVLEERLSFGRFGL